MPTISAPQNIFLNELNTKYRAYVGGFGSGKTFVGCMDLLNFFGKHPRTRQGYFGTSYPSIRDIFYPTFEEAALMMGFTVDIKESNKEVHVYRNGFYYGTVICRSMDRPNTIVGFKVSRALVDEIDTLPKDKATNAWNKIVARLRLKIDGVENGIGVTTTPEGFLFVYSKFKDEPTKSYSMVQASTYENAEFLPDDYIDTLKETYPEGLIDAYLMGKFVNLTAGSVYPQYGRNKNNSFESIQPQDPLIVGMDFNVNDMAACIFVERDGIYHCVEELTKGRDTDYMARILKERYLDKGHRVTVYPDASGKNTSSKGADKSDIDILKSYGLWVVAKDSNPRVRERVNCVNRGFQDLKIMINSMRCPETAKCIEQQPYDKNGEPDKKSGLDHQTDAFGYPMVSLIPLVKPVAAPRFRR
ncbi:phage terminase large subunit [Pseudoalteromonas phage H105/1]|uniref:phage terminase large subunit n=1 Tax=Pseudoalteromonas phage H105/1 TaxID=877240 RepID=UPI0001E439D6|nr:phage terminase large subunit [Pseudoalteromonas phage H105/1]ADM26679.1 phage terminase large subunit [Pseudoalteromonas phage H105/1]